MLRHELEHLIRASTSVLNIYEVLVIGSQSILGAFPHAPGELLRSREADLCPWPDADERKIDLIDGVLGEGSTFDDTFGYYAQGVGLNTAVLPMGWQSRLLRIQTQATGGMIGWCLDPGDLFLSKLHANREKDRDFCLSMLSYRLINPAELQDRVAQMPVDAHEKTRLKAAIQRMVAETDRGGTAATG